MLTVKVRVSIRVRIQVTSWQQHFTLLPVCILSPQKHHTGFTGPQYEAPSRITNASLTLTLILTLTLNPNRG